MNVLLHFEDEEISNIFKLKLMRKRKKARQEQLRLHHLHLVHIVKKASKGKELICHPSEFKEVDDMENDSLTRIKRKANSFKRKSNPYSKFAFIYDFSDDSDFE